jgi:hypothetical protein
MKTLKLILFLLLTTSISNVTGEGNSDDTNHTAGFIDIIVQSNINRLVFKYDLRGKCLFSANGIKTKYTNDTSGLRISIPVSDFQIRNQSAYKDFLTLLKSDQFPYLQIEIPQNPGIFIPENGSGILKNVTVTVAGVSKKYDIDCSIEKTGTENEILLGLSHIRLTDFEIEPPVKFSGLIKVRDEIIVKFGFCMQNIGDAVKSI